MQKRFLLDIGPRSSIWQCIRSDARCVGQSGPCLLCTRAFCIGCQNGNHIIYVNSSVQLVGYKYNMTDTLLQYQNCLRKFYYNTDTHVLQYLARTHYEAEQWQECKKTLLRAIHLAPSNYTLRFDAGVAMQKFSASTLQKTKRTADEVSKHKTIWYCQFNMM